MMIHPQIRSRQFDNALGVLAGTGRHRWLLLLTLLSLPTIFLTVPGAGATSLTSRLPRTISPRSWSRSIRVDEGPTASGGTVVITTDAGGTLEDLALNAATGSLQWSVPVTLSLIPPTDPAPPLIVDGVALVLTPLPDYLGGYGAGLEGVTVSDGAPAWAEPEVFGVVAPPVNCPGVVATTDFCVLASASLSAAPLFLVLDARTGNVVGEYAGLGASLAPALYTTLKTPTSLSYFNLPTGFGWKRSIATIFGSDAFRPQYGAQVALVNGTYVMTLNRAPDGDVQDLSKSLTIGVSVRTGATLWKDVGDFECGGVMPVAGPYLCRESGDLAVMPGQGAALANARVTIEGINESTGKVRWQFQVGDPKAFLGGSGVAVAPSGQVVVPNSDGVSDLLDLATGKTERAPTNASFWCPSEEGFVDKSVPSADVTRIASWAFASCRVSRSPAQERLVVAPPEAIRAGGSLVWVTTTGVFAVPRTQR